MVTAICIVGYVLWLATMLSLPYFLNGYSPGSRLSMNEMEVDGLERAPLYVIGVVFPPLFVFMGMIVGITSVLKLLPSPEDVGKKLARRKLPKAKQLVEK